MTRRPRVAVHFSALALATALATLVAGGCGGGATTHRELTERERDSTLGKSAIPGAAAVTRTLAESDSMTARAARQDATVPASGQ
jgi:hypothetical protein